MYITLINKHTVLFSFCIQGTLGGGEIAAIIIVLFLLLAGAAIVAVALAFFYYRKKTPIETPAPRTGANSKTNISHYYLFPKTISSTLDGSTSIERLIGSQTTSQVRDRYEFSPNCGYEISAVSNHSFETSYTDFTVHINKVCVLKYIMNFVYKIEWITLTIFTEYNW